VSSGQISVTLATAKIDKMLAQERSHRKMDKAELNLLRRQPLRPRDPTLVLAVHSSSRRAYILNHTHTIHHLSNRLWARQLYKHRNLIDAPQDASHDVPGALHEALQPRRRQNTRTLEATKPHLLEATKPHLSRPPNLAYSRPPNLNPGGNKKPHPQHEKRCIQFRTLN
jgi:hypothetical protein